MLTRARVFAHSWLHGGRGQAQSWSAFTNNTRGFTKLTFLDVSRNVLSGTLPPELGNISTSLQLIVFDNNITGTVPSGTFGPCPTGILTHRVLTCPGLHALPSV